ncbi:MAG: hypothetical protein A2V86_17470 [Deltaproteobacteria bacterium RBG_16_49_23]|nr:MAG: hypothetical protein A2V86_17470 [Deltaproteobacteria bacterium RBG_16_49_23]
MVNQPYSHEYMDERESLVVYFLNKVTYEIPPLNPSLPPFTKGRRTISPLYQRGVRGDFSDEGPSNVVQKYVSVFMVICA